MDRRGFCRSYGAIEIQAAAAPAAPDPRYPYDLHPLEENVCHTLADEITARSANGSWSKRRIGAVAIGVGLALLVALVRLRSDPPGSRPGVSGEHVRLDANYLQRREGVLESIVAPRPQAHATNRLSFTALNFYHVRDGKPAQDYPWLENVKLVEPYRETALSVENPRQGFGYSWTITPQNGDEGSIFLGNDSDIAAIFTKLGETVVTLRETDSTGAVTRTLQETVMVKYVRRELRTLTTEERDELLEAMYTLWTVSASSGDGTKLYGEDYADIVPLSILHYAAASPATCDHFHDGLGFLTSHSQLTNTFEYNLQLVNPKLALPYWDFTIEKSAEFMSQDGIDAIEPQLQSPMFEPTWFGGSDPADYQVKDGRWAYMALPTLHDNEGDVFSRLRAPWNVNPRPYITRGMGTMCGIRIEAELPWPTCEIHHDLLTNFPSFYSWVWQSQYDPHGPVHLWIGGAVGCEESYGEVTSLLGEEAGKNLALLSFINRKGLYRDGLFKCKVVSEESVINESTGPKMASMSSEQPADAAPQVECGCLDYDLKNGDAYKFILSKLAYADNILHDTGLEEDTKRRIVEIICNDPMAEGEQLQAGSPFDPSFWSVHPTMERLWMFKRLTGTLTDMSWPDEDIYRADGTVESLSVYSSTCDGHRGSDVFPFGVMDEGDFAFAIRSGISTAAIDGTGNTNGDSTASTAATNGNSRLTNREVLEALDPRLDTLPYVYDTFSWPHCEAEGIQFDDAWSAGSEQQVAPDPSRGVMAGVVPKSLRGAVGG